MSSAMERLQKQHSGALQATLGRSVPTALWPNDKSLFWEVPKKQPPWAEVLSATPLHSRGDTKHPVPWREGVTSRSHAKHILVVITSARLTESTAYHITYVYHIMTCSGCRQTSLSVTWKIRLAAEIICGIKRNPFVNFVSSV